MTPTASFSVGSSFPTIDRYITDIDRIDRHQRSGYPFRDRGIALSPLFSTALWELCRRGVLRPGLSQLEEGRVGNDTFGCGYSITQYGRTWLSTADFDQLASVIPARFVELLSAHQARFGPGFLARGSEAVQCYSSHAFLACCAMCGASTESILLALASEKAEADDVIRMYSAAGGRKKIEDLLIGQAADHVKREFRGFLMLLAYWRDEAAHGRGSSIGDTEAFTSLMLLLRFARYADDIFPTVAHRRSAGRA